MSYTIKRRRPLEIEVRDWVFLKVSPTEGIMRFGMAGKLSSRYIGPYPIRYKVVKVAYQLQLPQKLSKAHNVLNMSQLRK